MCREKGFSYLNLPVNLGIGGAVQTGYRYAYYHAYDLAVQFDGDGQHSAKFLAQMAKVLEETESDMVIGSRFIEKEGSLAIRDFDDRYSRYFVAHCR